MAGNEQGNPPLPTSVMPCWTSPRRLAHLGKEKVKQTEMNSGILQMLSANPFAGLDHEDPFQHLTTFYQIAGSLGPSEEEEEPIFSRLFPFSLIGKAKELYLDQAPQVMTDWTNLEKEFQ